MFDAIWQLAKPFAFLWLPSAELTTGNKDEERIRARHDKSFPFNNKNYESRFRARLLASSDLSISSDSRRIDSCRKGRPFLKSQCGFPPHSNPGIFTGMGFRIRHQVRHLARDRG
jgi:hypothetical protein